MRLLCAILVGCCVPQAGFLPRDRSSPAFVFTGDSLATHVCRNFTIPRADGAAIPETLPWR